VKVHFQGSKGEEKWYLLTKNSSKTGAIQQQNNSKIES